MHKIPDAELDVLTCLHRLEEATAADIRRELEPVRPMAHGSVVTLLNRLERKALVTHWKGSVGKAFVYRATHKREVTARPLLRNMLQRAFGGDKLALVASLFETKPPTPEELEELERLVTDLKQKKGARS
jgi:BlaI family transcriptional regulator, penicillinase repressor